MRGIIPNDAVRLSSTVGSTEAVNVTFGEWASLSLFPQLVGMETGELSCKNARVGVRVEADYLVIRFLGSDLIENDSRLALRVRPGESHYRLRRSQDGTKSWTCRFSATHDKLGLPRIRVASSCARARIQGGALFVALPAELLGRTNGAASVAATPVSSDVVAGQIQKINRAMDRASRSQGTSFHGWRIDEDGRLRMDVQTTFSY